MSNLTKKTAVLALALGSAFALAACDVDQTQEGELPDVDVQAEGGQVPAYDVDAPDVDVNTEEVTVPVPDVDITPADETEMDDPEDVNDPADVQDENNPGT